MLDDIIPASKLSSLAFRGGLLLLAVVSLIGVGIAFGGQLERTSWQKKAIRAAEVSTRIINTKEGETQQCRAEVEKYNKATAALQEKLQDEFAKDREARKQAELEAIARDKDSREKAKRVLIALQGITEGIENGKFDACTGTVADSNLIGLLNEAITANRDSYAGRDGGLPGGQTDN